MTHPHEQLSAYADGELTPVAAAEVEAHLARCTECSRELAIVNTLKGAMQAMETNNQKDLWAGVHRRLTRPVGWILILAGIIIWVGLAVDRWFRQELTIEWLAATAVVIGVVMLAIGIGYEQYRTWRNERYKDVER